MDIKKRCSSICYGVALGVAPHGIQLDYNYFLSQLTIWSV